MGQTKWNDASLSGGGRFSYSEEKSGFGQLVSRRGSVLVEEINLAKKEREILLFVDLDVMVLGDPRTFFCGNFDLWGQDASSYVTGPFNSGFFCSEAYVKNDCNIRIMARSIGVTRGGRIQPEIIQ